MCFELLLKAKPCPVASVKLKKGVDKIYTNQHVKRLEIKSLIIKTAYDDYDVAWKQLPAVISVRV